MVNTTVRSPGGWAQLLNGRVAKAIVIGTIALGGGSYTLYGVMQGRAASHYVQVELTQVASADKLITAKVNPVQETESGSVVASHDSEVCFDYVPSPASTLDVGLTDADGEGSTDLLFNGLVPQAGKCFTLFQSGALATNPNSRVVVSPADKAGAGNSGTHIAFRWKTGSGQYNSTGKAAGYARIRVDSAPENLSFGYKGF